MDLLALPFASMEPRVPIRPANDVSNPHGSLMFGRFSGKWTPPGSCHWGGLKGFCFFFLSSFPVPIQVTTPPVAFDVICDVKYSFCLA